jgi:hypothetical protein
MLARAALPTPPGEDCGARDRTDEKCNHPKFRALLFVRHAKRRAKTPNMKRSRKQALRRVC